MKLPLSLRFPSARFAARSLLSPHMKSRKGEGVMFRSLALPQRALWSTGLLHTESCVRVCVCAEVFLRFAAVHQFRLYCLHFSFLPPPCPHYFMRLLYPTHTPFRRQRQNCAAHVLASPCLIVGPSDRLDPRPPSFPHFPALCFFFFARACSNRSSRSLCVCVCVRVCSSLPGVVVTVTVESRIHHHHFHSYFEDNSRRRPQTSVR